MKSKLIIGPEVSGPHPECHYWMVIKNMKNMKLGNLSRLVKQINPDSSVSYEDILESEEWKPI